MGKVASRLMRPVRNFNVENRAWRALEKQHEQGIAAPKHPSTVDQITENQKESRLDFASQQEKSASLHENLKGLHVENQMASSQVKTSRPLPESRQAHPETDLGTMDTTHVIPEGRANLKTVLGFISLHQIDPNQVTAQDIADEHKLDLADVQNVLTHFKAFNLHIPQEMYQKNKNLKKIVNDQLNSASTNVNQLRLSIAKEEDNGSDPGGAKPT